MTRLWRWRRGRDWPATAANERIYAIGDVHGRFDLLLELLERIRAHAITLRPNKHIRIVLLGDLVDRGGESRQVLEYAARLKAIGAPVVALKGNHEDMLLRVIDREISVQGTWLQFGGDAFLDSFDIALPTDGDHPWLLADRVQAAMGARLVDFVRAMPLWTRSGDYLFVHAGIRPDVRMARQRPADLMWIRDDFLESRSDHGMMVVHGHTITPTVEMQANRIGIDTGAYRTGRLSALFLEGTRREVLATGEPDLTDTLELTCQADDPDQKRISRGQ